jgi:hypothetical protein
MSDQIEEHSAPRRTRNARRLAIEDQVISQDMIDPDTGLPFTRRSRKGGDSGAFDIPSKFKKPGWDYQWVAVRVMGKEEDSSALVEVAEGGWRAVKTDEMRGFMPSGWEGNVVERKGMRLFKRPMHLTLEAQDEQLQRAKTQKMEKFASAQLSAPGEARRTLVDVQTSYERLPGGMVEEVQEV